MEDHISASETTGTGFPAVEPTAAKAVHADKPPASSKPAVLETVFDWLEMIVFALAAVALLYAFVCRIVSVDGDSMNPTLHNTERLIVSSNLFYQPKAGDIVIINRYTKEPLVKRIVAVEGDELTIDKTTHQVIVNGVVLDEPYIQGVTNPLYYDPTTQIIPEGCVFVMGDNRENSSDSRFPAVGFVRKQDIIGKAVFRLLPLDVMGGLY